MRLNERLNMANLRERALRALGLEYEGDDDNGMDWVSDDDGAMREMPNEAEIIGLLLLELRSLTRDNFGPLYSAVAEPPDEILEALVLAVEAAREGK